MGWIRLGDLERITPFSFRMFFTGFREIAVMPSFDPNFTRLLRSFSVTKPRLSSLDRRMQFGLEDCVLDLQLADLRRQFFLRGTGDQEQRGVVPVFVPVQPPPWSPI